MKDQSEEMKSIFENVKISRHFISLPEDDVAIQGSDGPVRCDVGKVPEHHLARHDREGEGPHLQYSNMNIHK